jgi:hypothetical protein
MGGRDKSIFQPAIIEQNTKIPKPIEKIETINFTNCRPSVNLATSPSALERKHNE